MHDKNPYSHAVNAYGATLSETSPRALESQLLLKAAQKLEMLANALRNGENPSNEEIHVILEYNQKLWTVFVGDTMDKEHPLPQEIKNNIASLGVFIFNRTKDLLISCSPERLKVLIDINRNIASGLMKSAANAAEATAPATQPAATPPAMPTDNLI